jgi:hypothetical protein
MGTNCCARHRPEGHQSNKLIRSTPASRQLRLPEDSLIRNEFIYDLFRSDLSAQIIAGGREERDRVLVRDLTRPGRQVGELRVGQVADRPPPTGPAGRHRTHASQRARGGQGCPYGKPPTDTL